MSYVMLVEAADQASRAFLSPKTAPALKYLKDALLREQRRSYDRDDARINNMTFEAVDELLKIDGFMVKGV